MKPILLFLFCFSCFLQGQTREYIADASRMGYGYSYYVTLGLADVSKSDGVARHEIKLLKIQPDPKGYLKGGKYFLFSQLGSTCDPLKNVLVQVKYAYLSNGTLITTDIGPLDHIGDSLTLAMGSRDTFKEIKEVFVSNLDISTDCNKRINEILVAGKK